MLRSLGVSGARHRLVSLLCWLVALAACVATSLFGVTGESLFEPEGGGLQDRRQIG
jgi:hypothetical protein